MPGAPSHSGGGGSPAFRTATSDPDEHAGFWRAIGAARELDQLGAGRFRGLLAAAGGGTMLATVSGSNRLVQVRGTAPRRRIGVAFDLGGQGGVRGHAGPLPADAALLLGGGGEIDDVWEAGARVGSIVCDLDALGPGEGEIAGRALEAAAGPGELLLPTSLEGLAALGRLVGVLRAVEDGTALPWSPATDACVREDFLTLVADVAAPGGDAPGRGPASAQRARLAEEFLRARLDRPVALAELCAEIGAGERTLRADFHERFGMGPIAYLRRLRLNGARRALRAGGTSVTAAATDWGFCHFGEFSAAYRALFGELPSQTLRGAAQAAAAGPQSFARST